MIPIKDRSFILNPCHEQRALIIFAREPRDGKVKTRLSHGFPLKFVTELYSAFVHDVLDVARAVNGVDRCMIFYAGHPQAISFLRQASRGFALKRQRGADLGERMHRAFCYAQKEGCDKTVIIGTDCLTLKPKDIESAFTRLNRVDVVLGPSRDGGYYLIGLKKPQRVLFSNVSWGTSQVLGQTQRNAQVLGLRLSLLHRQDDIDTAAQLRKLVRWLGRNAHNAPHTRRMLAVRNFPEISQPQLHFSE